MRCLTLAEVLARTGATSCFVCRDLEPHLRDHVRRAGHELVELPATPGGARADVSREDARETLAALGGGSWDWIVVDHYALDARWERQLRSIGQHVLVIDDLADRAHDCDALVDQNLYCDMETRYRGLVPENCDSLLGPRFALLADVFRESRAQVNARRGPVRRVLIGFGGTDSENNTGVALEAVAGMAGGITIDVVIGATHPTRVEIEKTCGRLGFACHVQTTRMAELMAVSDLALGAGGTTVWERCCLGLPALLFPVAENQRKQLSDAAMSGIVYAPDVPMGALTAEVVARHTTALVENGALRYAISRRGMDVVDGNGALRVSRRMGSSDITLRAGSERDSRNLFEWRNDPRVRAVSNDQRPLQWDGHQRWLASVLGDPNRVLLIGQREGADVGVVRFDIQGDEAEVSIYLVPGDHRSGTGSELLRTAERFLVASRPGVRVCRARVLAENGPSHGLFRGSGYTLEVTGYAKKLTPS
jgi:UDP-2,4-diacetamido-2,4,6-trideoxy-beta-L-altropyranose hydrolase